MAVFFHLAKSRVAQSLNAVNSGVAKDGGLHLGDRELEDGVASAIPFS